MYMIPVFKFKIYKFQQCIISQGKLTECYKKTKIKALANLITEHW